MSKLNYGLTVILLALSVQSTCILSVRGNFEGWVVDVYTQNQPYDGKGLGQASDAFTPQETVILYANVTYNQYPMSSVPVSLCVMGPPNPLENFTFRFSAISDERGIAECNFTIPSVGSDIEVCVFGTWTVKALVRNASDTLTFKVGWIISMTSLSATFLPQGRSLNVQVTVNSIAMASLNLTLSLTCLDSRGFIFGCLSQNLLLNVDSANFTIEYIIPQYATPGEAMLRALATRPDGAPYSPEVSTTFWIPIIGDLNGDGKVDMFDVSTAARAFGSVPGHDRWNPLADINYDGKVDIKDLATVAKRFGESYPNT